MELSIEQTCALQQFENGDNLFITGEGGTGKTTLIKHLIRSCGRRNKKYQVCAMTGCAALLLGCNARTIHSWSGIRLAKGNLEDIVRSVLYNRKSNQSWNAVDILVIDEVSMMSKRIFDLLNEIGKRTRRNSKPFGGIQVIFCGDFYQLPPVCIGDEVDGDKMCFESAEWYKTFDLDNHIVLNTIFRQKDPLYKSILMQIRKGTIDAKAVALLKGQVDRKIDPEKTNGCVPPKLYPRKAQVENINNGMFRSLEGECFVYDYISRTNCTTVLETNVPLPYSELQKCRKELTDEKKVSEVRNLLNNASCTSKLELKTGTSVMCTVNLDMDNGICNGSTGVVCDFVKRANIPFPIVQFSNGLKREIPIKFWQSEEYPVVAIGQFPLCHAWAMTIHKIQGATLDMAEMDIGAGIFEYGQTYVALSRVRSLDGLYLTGFDPSKVKINPKVQAFYDNIPEVEYEEEEVDLEEEKQKQLDETVKRIQLDDGLGFEEYACPDENVKKILL